MGGGVLIGVGLTSLGVMVFSLGVIHFGCRLVMGVLGGVLYGV